ncbi:hypothetical protein C823_007186 [Eubacterium plexicaudatum ASF492]|nr:hypothetical protein C823_007186 [Eubacterium plexicaudatum ASF492]
MMVVIPFWSGGYTFIYMCIPLIVFFRDAAEKKAGMDSYFYAGMFALLFSFFFMTGRYADICLARILLWRRLRWPFM